MLPELESQKLRAQIPVEALIRFSTNLFLASLSLVPMMKQ